MTSKSYKLTEDICIPDTQGCVVDSVTTFKKADVAKLGGRHSNAIQHTLILLVMIRRTSISKNLVLCGNDGSCAQPEVRTTTLSSWLACTKWRTDIRH